MKEDWLSYEPPDPRAYRSFMPHYPPWLILLVCAISFACVARGCAGMDRQHGSIVRYPAEWRMPAYPGMGGLRLAMIHDVLCERFPTHGAAWHEARVRELLARLPAADATLTAEQLPLVDDLGVSLERLGRTAEAVAWFRRKAQVLGLRWPPPVPRPHAVQDADAQYAADLAAIHARGPLSAADEQRYTTWANLGTVLIHGNLRQALAGGDAAEVQAAQEQVAQGLAALCQAVELNPAAHFGRERWQITLVQHLLAAARAPDLLRRYDAIGQPLRETAPEDSWYHPRAHFAAWEGLVPHAVMDLDAGFHPGFTAADADRLASDGQRTAIRDPLITIGADNRWVAAVDPLWRAPAAWDQPVLGALGLWTLGGGASPHLALLLANTCEQIGQRHLALEAYLRVDDLADRYSGDPATVVWLRQRIAQRMDDIALHLTRDKTQASDLLAATRARHQQELAWALDQRARHEAWEAARLAAGTATADPALDAWWATAPKLASDPGTADEVWERAPRDGTWLSRLAGTVLGAGIGVWIGILLWRRQVRRERKTKAQAANRPAGVLPPATPGP